MELNHVFIGNVNADKLIIFLHEGLGSIQLWKEYPLHVCEALDAYGLVYDRAGYGQSPGTLVNRQPDYLHQAADELATVIQELVPKKYEVYLYGHSDGGSIALIHAAQHPKHIKAVITEAAHVFVEPETTAGVRAARPLFDAGKFDGLKKYHGDRYKEVFMAWNSIWLSPEFESWNITDLLPDIQCPQLIIQGLDDQYGTLKQVETIQNQTAGASTIFTPANCGHAPHKELPDLTLTNVITFIHAIAGKTY